MDPSSRSRWVPQMPLCYAIGRRSTTCWIRKGPSTLSGRIVMLSMKPDSRVEFHLVPRRTLCGGSSDVFSRTTCPLSNLTKNTTGSRKPSMLRIDTTGAHAELADRILRRAAVLTNDLLDSPEHCFYHVRRYAASVATVIVHGFRAPRFDSFWSKVCCAIVSLTGCNRGFLTFDRQCTM